MRIIYGIHPFIFIFIFSFLFYSDTALSPFIRVCLFFFLADTSSSHPSDHHRKGKQEGREEKRERYQQEKQSYLFRVLRLKTYINCWLKISNPNQTPDGLYNRTVIASLVGRLSRFHIANRWEIDHPIDTFSCWFCPIWLGKDGSLMLFGFFVFSLNFLCLLWLGNRCSELSCWCLFEWSKRWICFSGFVFISGICAFEVEAIFLVLSFIGFQYLGWI